MPDSKTIFTSFDIILPDWMHYRVHGTEVWTWLLIPVLLLVIWFLVRVLGKLVSVFLKRKEDRQGLVLEIIRELRSPVELGVGIWLFRYSRAFLPLDVETKHFWESIELMVGTITGLWLVLRMVRLSCDRLAVTLDRSGKPHAKAVIPLMRKVLKTTVVILGLIFLLQNMNVDVGAMLAGLGIGGLALALAGQKTVENLFAGVSLVMDQPARVGDFCKYGDSVGMIEDIGLRSTRIRTPDRTLVTIPNSKLAEMQIENFAWRDKILFKSTIGLRYDTQPAAIREVLEAVKTLFYKRPEVAEGGRIRFAGLNANSMDLEIFAYIQTSDFLDFLVIREELLLEIMDIVKHAGARFAAPFPPVVLEKEGRRAGE
ncbi:mechanosensitive ion channel family protein [Luteolibacter pohnpeiensis]|uniref:Mechanosensitive ion channel family protein n=1 Tax=Luteolibacter pohnpeiensis TaxID=454153 RepID=A0A934S4S3_9BACT|nr:mechanosensitive ion channel family protein [Luteolibacter pohnpeiensis]MBK1883120.1 mechanosensitive ion channel family protein [Luteolibacter pohnpeiensis]